MKDCTFAYKEYLFDTHCGYDQLWLHALASVIDKQITKDEWLESAQKRFLTEVEAHSGLLYLKLDNIIDDDPNREAKLIELSKQAYGELQTLYPESIPEEEANNIIGSVGNFIQDVPTKNILEVGALFIKLLQGDVTSDPRFTPVTWDI